MRYLIATFALIASTGLASVAQAGCLSCPEGYSFWHRKDACVPKIEGFVGTPPASTWVDPLPQSYYAGKQEDTSKKNGPVVDR